MDFLPDDGKWTAEIQPDSSRTRVLAKFNSCWFITISGKPLVGIETPFSPILLLQNEGLPDLF
jgi:hypothetical protein